MKNNITMMFSTEFNTELKVLAWDKFKEVFHITTPRSTYFKKLTRNVDYIEHDGHYFLLLASAISLASYSRVTDKQDHIYELTTELYGSMDNVVGSLLHGLEAKLHQNYMAYAEAAQGDLQMLGVAIGKTINATYAAANYGSTESVEEVLDGNNVVITEPEFPEDKYPQEPIIHTEEETDYD